GIAKVLTGYPTFTEALAATKAGPVAFTPRYGAPEQFNKARGPSGPWTGVFALRLLLVWLLSGQKARAGLDPAQPYVAPADRAPAPLPVSPPPTRPAPHCPSLGRRRATTPQRSTPRPATQTPAPSPTPPSPPRASPPPAPHPPPTSPPPPRARAPSSKARRAPA